MTTAVSVRNRTRLSFKTTVVLFGEMSTPAEQFWSSKASRSTIEGGEQAVFGKLLHSHELSGKANVIVSVVLTLNDETAPQHRDTLITLKTRLKGSKTGCKVYVLVASFPESTLLSTPVWRKDSGKVQLDANSI